MTAFDDVLRASARRLDTPTDPFSGYRAYRELERRYTDRVSSDDGAAALAATCAAISTYFHGEDAARAGDHEQAAAHFAEAERDGALDTPTTLAPHGRAPWQDAELGLVAAAAGRGDRAAVTEVLHRIRPVVTWYCRARMEALGTSDRGPDDVVREVCMAVITALPTWRPGDRPFMATVYAAASRAVVEEHHAAVQAPRNWRAPGLSHEGGTEATLAALATLPATERDVVVMRVLLGMSTEQAAQELGLTTGAVRVAQHRAMRALRSPTTSGRG